MQSSVSPCLSFHITQNGHNKRSLKFDPQSQGMRVEPIVCKLEARNEEMIIPHIYYQSSQGKKKKKMEIKLNEMEM